MSLRLYCSELQAGSVTLSPEESHHASTVMRCRRGDAICLFDGRGREAAGTVIRVDTQRLEVEVETITARALEAPYHLSLFVAMPKSHRQGILVEKCTELGAGAIQALTTQRSVAKPGPGAAGKWRRRAIDAAKQSGRAWLPIIEKPIDFAEALTRIRRFDLAVICDGRSTATFTKILSKQPPGSSIVAWIGPEGGWTDAELEQAQAAGAVRVSLGRTVLRTETAAIAISAAVAGLAGA